MEIQLTNLTGIPSALGLSIGETIFLNQLKASARALTPSIPYSAIINAGAYKLRKLADSDELYKLLQQVYMDSLHNTYILPLVVTGLACLTTFAVERKNIKKLDEEREREREDARNGV